MVRSDQGGHVTDLDRLLCPNFHDGMGKIDPRHHWVEPSPDQHLARVN